MDHWILTMTTVVSVIITAAIDLVIFKNNLNMEKLLRMF